MRTKDNGNRSPSRSLDQKPGSKKRSASETKARILKAALAEFSVHGFSGARVSGIAERAAANKRMIYAYVGNKHALWGKALEEVYAARLSEERRLEIDCLAPEEAMRALVRFNFRYHVEHPEFIALLNSENQMGARTLRRSSFVRELYSPLLKASTDVLRRGQEMHLFRGRVDPIQLYISIAALGHFYCSNAHTLSAIFGRNLTAPSEMQTREEHIIEVVMGYLRAEPQP